MPKAGIQFSSKDEWYTPKEIVAFFGPFDYDPATTPDLADYHGIPYFDTIQTDGLNQIWHKYKMVWCNPPFTRKFEFLKKAVEEYSEYTTVYFLMPIDSLCTKTFARIMNGVSYILWLPNGRINFLPKTSSPAFGSVILELSKCIKHTSIKRLNLDEV